jgi:DNA-binding transcriptional MerR regulator/methylmalonyl-CoA mutase cobalamin-binding subunit
MDSMEDNNEQKVDKTKTPAELRHPIQVVARRTGLSQDVVRIWERRYGAVAPHRSTSGRRFYSDADIERLTLLRRATAAGRRISDVISLSDQELSALVGADRAVTAQAHGSATFELGNVSVHLAACRKAAHDMQPHALYRALANARVALSIPVLLDELVNALLHEMGEQWKAGSMRICQEHMAVAVVRSFLGELLTSCNRALGPVLIVTTPSGQYHELGAMMVAVIAASWGWEIVNLGPNTPAAEIAAAAAQTRATAVGLSIVYPPDDAALSGELRTLRRLLAEGTTLLVGGRAAPGYQMLLDEIGALCFRSQGELQVVLDGLRAAPRG